MISVHASQQASGLGILGALAVALYAGSNGAGAVMIALNIAYEEKQKRSLIRFDAVAFAITLIALIRGVIALAAMAAVAELEKLLPKASGALLVASKVGLYSV